MNNIPQREIGSTGTLVTEFGLGTAPLGDLFDMLDEDAAQGVMQAAWDVGVRFFDTSPFYGSGKSEHRVGHFLRQKPRDEFVLSTKVGRIFHPAHDLATFDPGPFIGALPYEFTVDYSYDGIMRSYEDSLQRLSLASIDLLVIHDLDFYFYETEARVNAYLNQLFTSGWRALDELRRHGLVKGVGAGINELGMIPRFLDLVELDFFLVAYGYNLLTQEMLEEEFPLCEEQGISIIVGAVFASGILATGAVPGAMYFYAPASPEMMERTNRIEQICNRYQTPLPCAALQFLLANPIVSAIIPGAMETAHVQANFDMLREPVPEELWGALKSEGLLREDAPIP